MISPMAKLKENLTGIFSKTLLALLSIVVAIVIVDLGLRNVKGFGPRHGTTEPKMEAAALTQHTLVMEPGYRGVLNGRDFENIEIHINDHGFRDLQCDIDALSSDPTVIYVGDSYLFGWGVHEGKRISNRLDEQLRERGWKGHCLNMAMPGWGPYQYLDVLRFYSVSLKPRLVVLGFFVGNDFLDSMEMHQFLRSTAGGEYESRKLSESRIQKTYEAIREYVHTSPVFNIVKYGLWNIRALRFLFNWLETRNDRIAIYDPSGGTMQEQLYAVTMRVFEQISIFSRNMGVPVLVVIIPDHLQVLTPDVLEGQDVDRPQRVLSSHLRKLGLDFIDLLEDFRNAPQPERLYFREDKHWSAEGHALAASLVLPYVIDSLVD
jgi:hypothetical protein